jgi:Ca2+-binding EF-hand superfamily protein/tRNA A-37 threonylcarbamoyl transferase component Bud32
MVSTIGEGRHGAVVRVQHKYSEKYYACKVLHKEDHEDAALKGEIEMLRRLDHPNIVRLYETNEDRDNVFLLMELCHSDLFTRITEASAGRLTECLSIRYAEQMLSALAYCHSKSVVHHDVKPENFLLESEEPDCLLKLADFGIATSIRAVRLGSDLKNEVEGSKPYMAPEMLSRGWCALVKEAMDLQGSERGIDAARYLATVDVWSCGIVVYVMLSGELPFGHDEDAICSGQSPDFSAQVWREVSREAVHFIKGLLSQEPHTRGTCAKALTHPWMQAAGIEQSNLGSAAEMLQMAPPSGNVALGMAVTAAERPELARVVLRSLRTWRGAPKLRRIVVAAIARRIEADHPSSRLAQMVYHTFSSKGDKLRCEELVNGLNVALSEAMTSPPAESEHPALEQEASQEEVDKAEQARRKASNSVTGLQVRRRLFGVLRKLGTVSPASNGGEAALLASCSEDLVSLTELRHLVGALDGVKNGTVDYTLLVAALLPQETCCEEARVLETFNMFDFRKHQGISPDDLLAYMKNATSAKETTLKQFSQMLSEFDKNGDGVLDLEEFKAMLCASEHHSPSDAGQ